MPNNPREKNEWNALSAHAEKMQNVHMRDLFDGQEDRFDNFSVELDGLLYDFSKNILTEETLSLLCDLARAQNIEKERDHMFSGTVINGSENRAVLHTALRGSCHSDIEIDGENVNEFIAETLEQVKEASDNIRLSSKIKHVVNIGIGGSDLGPALVCEALSHIADGPKMHFVSNVDGALLSQTLKGCLPEETIIIIASKTFSTLETMTNAESAKKWLGAYAADNIIAVTGNESAALKFGVKIENVLPMREWIGGRYSLWSAIGLPIAIAIGFEEFEKLLAGAQAADIHFKDAPLAKNIPVLMGLFSIWYRNFFDAHAYAVLPYAENLKRLPAYIQQLEMESNGKSVSRDGSLLDYKTAPVVFGDSGINAQHAFFQMIHQGSDMIPCDFIASLEATHNLPGHHEKLLASVIGQSRALMQGQEDENGHRNFPGNKPSSTILLPSLNSYHVGMLLALYEHKIFVEGIIWDINSFDQWGVELGKVTANKIISGFQNGILDADSSTKALIKRVKQGA